MDQNLLTDSFYQGVAILISPDIETNEIWNVIKPIHIDTKNDNNMNINFGSAFFMLQAVLIPASSVSGFKLGITRKIKRSFNLETGLESWKAL